MLWLPEKPNQRYIKFKLEDDTWKIRSPSNEKELQKFLNLYNPKDTYYSVGRFINPECVDKSEKYNLIKKDTIIDLDDTSFDNAKRCADLFNGKIKYILQTSKNSLQISVDETQKNIIKLLKENNIEFCPAIYNTDKSVVRMPLTKHNSNFITTFLNNNLEGFKGFDGEKEEKKKRQEYYFSFIRQKINNVDNCYIVFFKTSKKALNKAERRIRYLQKRHNLGDAYIIDYNEDFGVLLPKIVDFKKLCICNGRKQYLIRISEKRFKKDIIANKPKVFKIIKSPARGDYSKPHCDFLRRIGFECKYEIEIGKGRIGYGRFR